MKGQLATKVYGDDLQTLEDKANEIAGIMRQVEGIEDLGVFRVLGQPNLNVTVDRQQAARYQINVADVQDAIQTAVGGNTLTQVLQGEARYDLVLRYLPQYRDKKEAIQNIRLLSPGGERVSLAQLCKIEERDGASEIYREGNQRYIAIKYSVRGRDLGGAVQEAMAKVNEKVKLPTGYHIDWEGEYESQKRSEARLMIIVPLTVLHIFMIIYGAFGSVKWALLNLLNIVVAPFGGILALLVTRTHFSVSSGVGFLALFEEIRQQIREVGLIPSIRVESAEAAIFAAENVAAGGIPIVQIAAAIPHADQVIHDLVQRFPSLIVGSEVVAGLDEARRQLDAGAMFLTGPGFDAEIVGFCVEHEVVVLPGALTPTEVMLAHKAGADFVKVFPCSYVGGEKYIRALKAPLPHVPLVAAGGVTQSTASHFISAGAVALGVGEDLIPRQAVRFREGPWIRELASRFVNFVRLARAEMEE